MHHDNIDPVCDMHVEKTRAPAQFEYNGTTYYFCCIGCKERFAENPEKFLVRLKQERKGESR